MTKPKALLCWCGGKATVVVSWPASLKIAEAPLCKGHGSGEMMRQLGLGVAVPVEKAKRELADDKVTPPVLNLDPG